MTGPMRFEKVVRSTATRFIAKGAPASWDDLYQSGWVSLLETQHQVNDNAPHMANAYVATIMRRNMGREVGRGLAVVSLSQNKLRCARDYQGRDPVTDLTAITEPTFAAELEDADFLRAVRQELTRLLRKVNDNTARIAARLVGLDGHPPHTDEEVVRQLGVRQCQVNRARFEFLRAGRRSWRLRALWDAARS